MNFTVSSIFVTETNLFPSAIFGDLLRVNCDRRTPHAELRPLSSTDFILITFNQRALVSCVAADSALSVVHNAGSWYA